MARKLKLVETQQILEADGWQRHPPTRAQIQDHPRTWHIRNPGVEGIIGTRADNVEHVMLPGGVCRPYQATVRKADLPEFAGALAKHIFREISELDQFEGLVRLKDVAEVLVKYLPKTEGE